MHLHLLCIFDLNYLNLLLIARGSVFFAQKVLLIFADFYCTAWRFFSICACAAEKPPLLPEPISEYVNGVGA